MPNRKTPVPAQDLNRSAPDRRARTRHPCNYDAPFRMGDHFGTARVRDLSAGGVGLLLPRKVAPGGLLTVELPDRVANSWRLKLLHVVHATPRGGDMWLIGTTFTRQLTSDELQAVLP